MVANDSSPHPTPQDPAAGESPPLHVLGDAQTPQVAHDHRVQFYESDEVLVASVAAFIAEGLRAGRGGVVIGTRAHRSSVERVLLDAGFDLVDIVRDGRYVSADAADVLSRFMVDGMPDRQLFDALMTSILTPAVERAGHVYVFGEMVALLVEDGSYDAAIALERLWNDLRQRVPFSLLCGYPMNHEGGKDLTELFEIVMEAHTQVVPAESFTSITSPDARLREIALLQQKSVWLKREIAERRYAEERLRFALASEQEARQETEAALGLRDEFLSIAAHELKTPLTGLTGHVQLAMRLLNRAHDADTDERVRRSLHVIADQARKLTHLLDQLLDTSRIELGRMSIEPRLVDLSQLVRQCVVTARLVSERRPIAATTPSSLMAEVDPLRFEQMLANLLDNAIRHSPEGGRIDVTLGQPHEGSIEMTVRDRGPGIPVEFRERVFDRYYRLQGDDRWSGMGLGLHICREIVEQHGGSIRADSPADGGTVIIIDLPGRGGLRVA